MIGLWRDISAWCLAFLNPMEIQNGKQRRLLEAKEKREFVKLIFRYANGKVTLKSGYVQDAYPDSFDFDEIKDGHVTFDYTYLEQIQVGSKLNGGGKWGSV